MKFKNNEITPMKIKPCVNCISYAMCRSRMREVYKDPDFLILDSSIHRAYYKVLYSTCSIILEYFEIVAMAIINKCSNETPAISSYDEIRKDRNKRLYMTFIEKDQS